ncbi:nucleotidyltransferase domain-containing protein [Candidatus Kuenenbacteria bacterium]|nr:nucleotidyltransferase domain-containing protein [Candidatus Kuenenbacteria bacterium]
MEKRFSFSPEEPERKKRTGIQKAIEVLQKKYPEILGMTLFGSLAKGTDNKFSNDIDGYVYLEADDVAKKENMKTEQIVFYTDRNRGDILKGKVLNPRLKKEIAQKYEAEIRQELLQNNPELKPCQVEHTWVFPINEVIINNLIDGYVDRKYEAGDMLRGLFHLRVGQGKKIQKYRKIIIDKLDSLGERGEEAWQRFIHTVAFFEQDTRVEGTEARVEERYYPQTIQEAKRVY